MIAPEPAAIEPPPAKPPSQRAKLMETKPFTLVAVALANKLARIAFALLRAKTSYMGALA